MLFRTRTFPLRTSDKLTCKFAHRVAVDCLEAGLVSEQSTLSMNEGLALETKMHRASDCLSTQVRCCRGCGRRRGVHATSKVRCRFGWHRASASATSAGRVVQSALRRRRHLVMPQMAHSAVRFRSFPSKGCCRIGQPSRSPTLDGLC